MDELNLNIFQVDINEITELGILLYVAHNCGDNQIFIPMSQIICFHDFDKDHFKKINYEKAVTIGFSVAVGIFVCVCTKKYFGESDG